MIPLTNTDLRMNDKKSFIPVLKEHSAIFGKGILQSVATDKGYYSKINVKFSLQNSIETDGIQHPGNIKKIAIDPEQVRALRNRRSGIEPLIAHVKDFGLRKSKMRSDAATLSAGYRAFIGFNGNQIMRCMQMKVV